MQINEAEQPEFDEQPGTTGIILTTEQRLRMYVLKEIVNTEEDYVKLLEFITDVMIPGFDNCAQDSSISCVSHKTASAVLSNVSEICKLHAKFSAALKEATNPHIFHSNCIGNTFLSYRDEFRVYVEYCTNFSNAQKLCYQLESDPCVFKLINQWIESVASRTRKFLHLEDFVISPVQRLCKYPLLLRELKKFTTTCHPDCEYVSEAMKMMEDITTFVNESERRSIAIQAIKDLDDACDSWEKSGCMTKQGFMLKKRGSVKSWNIRWFTLSGYKLSYFHEPTDTKPLGVLDLTSYKSLDKDASHVGRPFSFGIKMPEKSFYFYCINETERQEWISILNWKTSCIDRTRRQAHRPLETVIFASLSSFLNPKDQNADFEEENPVGDKTDSSSPAKMLINRQRSQSFFKRSFRLTKRRRTKRSMASTPPEQTAGQ